MLIRQKRRTVSPVRSLALWSMVLLLTVTTLSCRQTSIETDQNGITNPQIALLRKQIELAQATALRADRQVSEWEERVEESTKTGVGMATALAGLNAAIDRRDNAKQLLASSQDRLSQLER